MSVIKCTHFLRSVFIANYYSKAYYFAAECVNLGEPLQLVEKNRSALKDDEVRIKLINSAINFGDILVTQGKYQVKYALPYIPGMEASGEIIEVGSKAKNVKVGDSVIALLMEESGAFAQEATTNFKNVFIVPETADKNYSAQASLLASYGTAYLALTRQGQVKTGEKVFVTASAGALGLAAVDLASNIFGAKTIGACGDDAKFDLVKKYGAEKVFNYKTANIKEELKAFTKGKGVDVVFDVVGGSIIQESIKSMSFEGRILTLGYASGSIPSIAANLLLVKNVSAHGIYWGSYSHHNPAVFQQSIKEVILLWLQGRIKPHVGQIFPLSQVNDAMRFIESRASTGKVLLDCQQIESSKL